MGVIGIGWVARLVIILPSGFLVIGVSAFWGWDPLTRHRPTSAPREGSP